MTQDTKRSYRKKTETDNVASAALETGNRPPQAVDIEEAVIGTMLIEPGCISDIVEVLHPKSFYDPKMRTIYETVAALYGERSAVDLLTVAERLRSTGKIDEVGGPSKLAELTQKVGAASHLEYYVRILQQKCIQRDLIDASFGILRDAFDESTNVDRLIETSQSRIFDAVQGNIRSEYKHISDVVNRSLDRIQEVQDKKGLSGIPSGFPTLDSMTMGWQPSNLVILGARPSVGKTAFALNLARNAAVGFGVPTAFFSLEMADTELTDRLIASESGISADMLKGISQMGADEWAHLERAISSLVKSPLYIDETPGITITEFTSKAKRLVREKDVKLIFVDYLQLMHASGQPSQYREQEVSAISQSLKATAKELHIPIIALSQLNRNLMSRQSSNGRPVLSDLRDSGSIEQDADMVIFLHRPGMLGLEDDMSRAELIIAKHRNGKVGSIDLTFDGSHVRFVDPQDAPLSGLPQEMPSAMNTDFGKKDAKKGPKDGRFSSDSGGFPYNPFDDFRSVENSF